MYDELGRMGKKVVVAYFKASLWHSFGGTGENSGKISEQSIPGKDLN
jgi:hypothetical protein